MNDPYKGRKRKGEGGRRRRKEGEERGGGRREELLWSELCRFLMQATTTGSDALMRRKPY